MGSMEPELHLSKAGSGQIERDTNLGQIGAEEQSTKKLVQTKRGRSSAQSNYYSARLTTSDMDCVDGSILNYEFVYVSVD
jgi:ribosome-binding ATPase YchF (GTP1/OBG family)